MSKNKQQQINPIESMQHKPSKPFCDETDPAFYDSMCEDMCRCKSPVAPVVATGAGQRCPKCLGLDYMKLQPSTKSYKCEQCAVWWDYNYLSGWNDGYKAEPLETLRTCRDHWKTSWEHERANVIRLRAALRKEHGGECSCDDCEITKKINSSKLTQ